MKPNAMIAILLLFFSATFFGQSNDRPDTRTAPGVVKPPTTVADASVDKYLGVWVGQLSVRGTQVEIALEFAKMQDSKLAGVLMYRASSTVSRMASVEIKPDGSIVCKIPYQNGSVATLEGTLDGSGQRISGTLLLLLGTQSTPATFTATRRQPVTQPEPQVNPAATAAADKAEAALASAESTIVTSGLASKYRNAEYWANDCVNRFPRFARCYEIRGRVNAALDNDPAAEQDYFRKAIEDLTKAIELDPGSPGLYWLRGRVYLYTMSRNKNPQLAIADAEAALKINPNFVLANSLLGEAKKAIAPK